MPENGYKIIRMIQKVKIINVKLIRHCFDVHKNDLPEIKFTFEQYREFWVNHFIGSKYIMRNRDGSEVTCEVVYYPLPNHSALTALIAIKIPNGFDYREIPVHFLNKIKK